MLRKLPRRAHIDHLKAQAKDLLAAYKRGEPDAAERFRASLPTARGLDDPAIFARRFALHDAQSVIAREYGFSSFQALRSEVTRRDDDPFPVEIVRALTPMHIPKDLTVALKDAWAHRNLAPAAPTDFGVRLPLVPIRNAFVFPGSVLPIHVGRARTHAAIDAALATEGSAVAVFTQREAGEERVGFNSLHAVGCAARVRARVPDQGDLVWVILEGQTWIRVTALDDTQTHQQATIETIHLDSAVSVEQPEVDALQERLRENAVLFARALPGAEKSIAALDAIEDPIRIADIVVGALPCAVADKVRYAMSSNVLERLRVAVELADAQLGDSADSRPEK